MIERINAEAMIFRIWKRDAHSIALHDAANAGGNLSEDVAEIEAGDHPVGNIEQKLQTLLGTARGLEIHGIVHGQRDLVHDEREETNLLAVAEPFLRSMIITALDTGMRQGEMLMLRFGDIDFNRQLILLRAQTTKSRKRRTIPISTLNRRSRPLLQTLSAIMTASASSVTQASPGATDPSF